MKCHSMFTFAMTLTCFDYHLVHATAICSACTTICFSRHGLRSDQVHVGLSSKISYTQVAGYANWSSNSGNLWYLKMEWCSNIIIFQNSMISWWMAWVYPYTAVDSIFRHTTSPLLNCWDTSNAGLPSSSDGKSQPEPESNQNLLLTDMAVPSSKIQREV